MNKSSEIRQLLYLTMAHFRELIREPGVLFWGIVFPILMSLGLGIAFTQKTETVRKIAVISKDPNGKDVSPGMDSILFRKALKISPQTGDAYDYRITIPDQQLGNTIFLLFTTDIENAMVMLKQGKVSVIVAEENGKPQYHFDPLNPDAQLSYIKLSEVIERKDVEAVRDAGFIRPLTLSGTRYIDFLVPGLVAMGVMMSCMWGISYGIIERRSKKLLRRMVATPMRKSWFLVSMFMVRFAMNFIESGLLVLFTWLAFDITIQGNVGALVSVFMAGNVAFAGMAVLVSSHNSNTEIGNGLINAVVMPMMVLSGIFFSYHNFPDWALPFIQGLPLTMLADSIRAIFNEGAGFGEILFPFTVLTLLGIVSFLLGLRFFKWH